MNQEISLTSFSVTSTVTGAGKSVSAILRCANKDGQGRTLMFSGLGSNATRALENAFCNLLIHLGAMQRSQPEMRLYHWARPGIIKGGQCVMNLYAESDHGSLGKQLAQAIHGNCLDSAAVSALSKVCRQQFGVVIGLPWDSAQQSPSDALASAVGK